MGLFMQRKWALSFGSLLLGCMVSHAAIANTEQLIENRYIVVLKSVPDTALQFTSQTLESALSKLPLAGVQVTHRYDSALLGFAASMPSHVAELLSQHALVDYVEQDRKISLNATQNNATWGLDRLDTRTPSYDMQYNYSSTGAGVHAYVLDSGLNATHQDFAGRVGNGFDATAGGGGGLFGGGLFGGGGGLFGGGGGLFGGGLFGPSPEPQPEPSNDPFDPSSTPEDCNGHGTHVAGTVGGTNFGVAKEVTLHAVRVVNCLGIGSGSDTLAGVEWVVDNHVAPAVMNLSLGGSSFQALDDALENALKVGIVSVVAAGNDSADACNYSPARESSAITVAATERSDARADYSNVGPCVDIFAPGSNIESAGINSNSAIAVMSGTSMASPHVAGAVAKLLGEGVSPNNVATELQNRATRGAVGQAGNTINSLLFSN